MFAIHLTRTASPSFYPLFTGALAPPLFVIAARAPVEVVDHNERLRFMRADANNAALQEVLDNLRVTGVMTRTGSWSPAQTKMTIQSTTELTLTIFGKDPESRVLQADNSRFMWSAIQHINYDAAVRSLTTGWLLDRLRDQVYMPLLLRFKEQIVSHYAVPAATAVNAALHLSVPFVDH